MGLQTFDETAPVYALGSLTQFSGTNAQTMYTTVHSERIDNIVATSTAAADHTVAISLLVAGGTFPLFEINVPASAGTLAVPPVDLLTAMPATCPALILPLGAAIRARVLVALTGAETISLACLGGVLG